MLMVMMMMMDVQNVRPWSSLMS